MQRFASAGALAAAAPGRPVLCFRPHRLRAAAARFDPPWPARPFYAVKANPAPHILRGLHAAGIRSFDVASLSEAKAVARHCPGARMAFMHPVKAPEAIRRAWALGARAFVLDHADELAKILANTPADPASRAGLALVVRIAVSNEGAAVSLAGKFGASADEAPALLRAARASGGRAGAAFHVGSQSLDPSSWGRAMADTAALLAEAGVAADIVDVGGGFPSPYGTRPVPPVTDYAGIIARGFAAMPTAPGAELWCEPGRALCAEAESLLVRVEAVRGGDVHLNDGAFGALYDAGHLDWRYPFRALCADGRTPSRDTAQFTAFGPTCDAADRLASKLALPASIRAGDYIEFGMLGAYGRAMASRFNGFGAYDEAELADDPFGPLAAPASADVEDADASVGTGT